MSRRLKSLYAIYIDSKYDKEYIHLYQALEYLKALETEKLKQDNEFTFTVTITRNRIKVHERKF